MADQKYGVEKTKAALHIVISLATILVTEFKDGIQTQDVVTIFDKIKSNDELTKQIVELYNHFGDVKSEVGELSTAEILDLVIQLVKEGKLLIEAIVAKPVAKVA